MDPRALRSIGLFASFVLMMSVGLIAASSSDPQEPAAIQELGYMRPWILNGLQRETCVYSLERAIKRLKAEPVYLQLSYAPYVIAILVNAQRVETLDYEWEPGSHDLRYVAARGAWVLESVLGIKVAPIDSSSTEADRKHAARLAQLQFDGYREGVMRAVRSYNLGKDLDGLTRKYQSKIQEGTEEYPSYGFHMHAGPHLRAMFDEFFPLGKKLADLETIIGRKAHSFEPKLRDRQSSEHATGVFEFLYQNGFSGEAFFFLVKDGVIEGVSVQSID